MPRLLEWLRMPGDLVFIFLGALPIAIALCLGYLGLWKRRDDGRRATAGFGGISTSRLRRHLLRRQQGPIHRVLAFAAATFFQAMVRALRMVRASAAARRTEVAPR